MVTYETMLILTQYTKWFNFDFVNRMRKTTIVACFAPNIQSTFENSRDIVRIVIVTYYNVSSHNRHQCHQHQNRKMTRPPPTLKRTMLHFAICINRCRCVIVFILIKIIPRQKSNARDFSSNILSAFPFVDHKRHCENTPSTLQNGECWQNAQRMLDELLRAFDYRQAVIILHLNI